MTRPYKFIILLSLSFLINSYPARADVETFSDLLNRKVPVASLRITYGLDPDQFGDLWLPNGQGPFQTIVLIHGGCWQEALPGNILMSFIAEDLRKKGFAVWNIEYRRLGTKGGGYPGTFLDIAEGIDFLQRIRSNYKLDLSHLSLVGHSAGGELALWAAGRAQFKSPSLFYRIHPQPVETVVTLSGINDLRDYRKSGGEACGGHSTIDALIGSSARSQKDVYADTSPAEMLPLHVKQIIITASKDTIVPSHFGRDYGAKAKSAGDNVEIIDIQNAGHFELIDPGTSAWQQVIDLIPMQGIKN